MIEVRVFKTYSDCPRCKGTGIVREYMHVQNGDCFLCLRRSNEEKARKASGLGNLPEEETNLLAALVDAGTIFDWKAAADFYRRALVEEKPRVKRGDINIGAAFAVRVRLRKAVAKIQKRAS